MFRREDPTLNSQKGATQAGKLIHEMFEQYLKQILDGNKEPNMNGFDQNHNRSTFAKRGSDAGNSGATGAEDAVNGNKRIGDFLYERTNGEIWESEYSPNNSTIRVSNVRKE